MKTAKLIIGIVSIVLFVVVAFQSCAAGLVEAIDGEGGTSGGGGILLALCMLIAGIVGIAARKSKGGSITSGAFYLLGALFGYANLGVFGDLIIWSVLCTAFGIFFIVSGIVQKKPVKAETPDTEKTE